MAPVESSDEEDEEVETESNREPPPANQEIETLDQPEVGPDGWYDLMDGKIKKRTIKEGEGGYAEMKQDVRCSVRIRVASDSESEPTETLMFWPDKRYRIGEGEAVPMLELCLRHMKEREKAELFGTSSMAWGPAGFNPASDEEKAIPPDVNITMEVQVIQLLAVHGASEPAWNDLIQEVTWRKTNGNDYYKRQEFNKALRSYGAGVELFNDNGFQPPDHVDEADKEKVRAVALNLVADCGANLAAVHLELDNAVAAKASAQAALEIRPEHLKSLYRLAKATYQLDEFDECENVLKRGFAVEAENAALLQVQVDLRRKQTVYQARSKKIAGKVFKQLDYPDLVLEREKKAQEDQKVLDEEDSWTFWIKKAFFEFFDKQIIIMLLISAVVLGLLFVSLPKRYWPMIIILFVMGVPSVIGLYAGARDIDAEKKTKKIQ